MERLFSPCTRMPSHSRGPRKLLHRLGLRKPLREFSLDVSTAELLSVESAFTYADLYAMLENKDTVLWLTPHAAVMLIDSRWQYAWKQPYESYRFYFHADGKKIVAIARSRQHVFEICDVLILLLAASVVRSVIIEGRIPRDGRMIKGPTLAHLVKQCQSLKVLKLQRLVLYENHCRVLGAYSRPDLEINLDSCKFTSEGASALAEVLGRNQGPTKLEFCTIDNMVLANGLHGNSRLKSLTLHISDSLEVGSRQILAIAGALKENKGLVELDLNYDKLFSDDAWDAICDSLKTHPTLQLLGLQPWRHLQIGVAPAVLKFRMQALVNMLKVNKSIQTLHWDSRYSEKKILFGTFFPHLETNWLRPRLLAIQKTIPFAYRAKVLGRAFLAVRTDPNHFWMLLSGNLEVALSSTTGTSTPGTNLSTLASVGISANAAAVVAIAAAN
jgi:hypothetical protein